MPAWTRKFNSTWNAEYCMPLPVWWRFQQCYSTVTLNFEFGENPTNTFQDIMLTSPESVVSCILYSTVNLTFWPQIVARSSLSHTASLMQVRWNVSNTLQDIALTMFRDVHTDARTDEQDKNSMRRPCWVGRRPRAVERLILLIALIARLIILIARYRVN